MPFDLSRFRGIFPAALTMFDKDDNLDEAATAQHWDWLIKNRDVDGLVIAGTSGEFIAMTLDERIRLFRLAREVVGGRVPMIFGSGHYSTRVTLDLSQEAQKYSADALIVILPYYQRPAKAEVMEHYRTLRKETNVPIMLYNNPLNTACAEVTPLEIARLVEEDVVHMVKSTFGTVEPIHDLSYLTGDRAAIFYGSFLAAYEGLCAGAHGWISGILNVVGKTARQMFEAVVLENDAQRGFEIWKRILPIVHLYTHRQLGSVSDLAIYRSILNLWGLKGGFCRRPFLPLSGAQESTLRALLERSGWIDPDSVYASLSRQQPLRAPARQS
jgi:dihydrodipicolinate synthase/N-acetylneuraminate lyase